MDATGQTAEQTPQLTIIEQIRRHAISGAVCGSVVNFVEGALNSPSGRRLSGGSLAVPKNALRIGSFVAWFGVVKSIRLAVAPDYPFETTVAWGVTDALFSMRHGLRAAGRSGIRGAALGVLVDMAEHSYKRPGASHPPAADDCCSTPESPACPAGFPPLPHVVFDSC
ncbi:mitochondrial import inner membrane translocase subunit TIM17-1-like [Triticum dicoccoides]|uniref:mitochondrial import inner membrane translocase subunit TIM17-1-like n=1 Tax=Triticum dicoccoides TaxID=85692 RepID=UPI0018915D54|nr:mitochondrial import inner membrane translocase subunit TIM17-1-like [Triticum dicoccoides]